MSEIWKDIDGWEGLYQISNKGNVRSIARARLLKPQPNSSGYLRVELKMHGKSSRRFVHRLVAEHFVSNPKPNEYAIVNHIDSNPLNNSESNLEWTTPLGNTQHAKQKGRLVRTKEWLFNQRKALEKYDRPVIGFDYLTGKTVVEFKSIQEAGRNGYTASSICNCCKGKRQLHKGLAWMYADGGAR